MCCEAKLNFIILSSKRFKFNLVGATVNGKFPCSGKWCLRITKLCLFVDCQRNATISKTFKCLSWRKSKNTRISHCELPLGADEYSSRNYLRRCWSFEEATWRSPREINKLWKNPKQNVNSALPEKCLCCKHKAKRKHRLYASTAICWCLTFPIHYNNISASRECNYQAGHLKVEFNFKHWP